MVSDRPTNDLGDAADHGEEAVEDLTDEAPARPGEAVSEEDLAAQGELPRGGLIEPTLVPIEHQREKIRGRIAQALIVLLFLVITAAFLVFVLRPKEFENLDNLLTIIFAPIIGLIGTVLGFYFGSESSETRGRSRR